MPRYVCPCQHVLVIAPDPLSGPYQMSSPPFVRRERCYATLSRWTLLSLAASTKPTGCRSVRDSLLFLLFPSLSMITDYISKLIIRPDMHRLRRLAPRTPALDSQRAHLAQLWKTSWTEAGSMTDVCLSVCPCVSNLCVIRPRHSWALTCQGWGLHCSIPFKAHFS